MSVTNLGPESKEIPLINPGHGALDRALWPRFFPTRETSTRGGSSKKTAAELCRGGCPHLTQLLLTSASRQKETCRSSRPASRRGMSEVPQPA